ncbi:hypothetical protein E2C01_079855 [Portunus trituberculatus]|uniref:Uncharacterized protein n=1 Tax=Portunus trituberculatus TaxID=210409 RepID=A0A5B7ITX3_PORTR|nr:hypothetical protein [Portunus trituberculatus]
MSFHGVATPSPPRRMIGRPSRAAIGRGVGARPLRGSPAPGGNVATYLRSII